MSKVWRRVRDTVVRDLRGLRLALRGLHVPAGLHAYRVEAQGRRRRLHLRVHPNGSGELFVDVSHVVYLTPSAAAIAHLLLEGIAPQAIVRLLVAQHPGTPTDQIAADVHTLEGALGAFMDPAGGCPTCSLAFERSPVFSHRAQAPYKADLALTYACNNRCPHCYNEPERRGIHPLGLSDWHRVVRTLARVGVPHIIFTGGEPTLYNGLRDVIRCAERFGQVTGVNTNGRRLADARFAAHLRAAGLDHVQITLASHRPELHNAMVGADAYEETVAGIRNCLAVGLHTLTNTTLTRRNADEAVEIVEFLHALGVQTFAMNGMICSGGGHLSPDRLAERELVPLLEQVRDCAEAFGMDFLWYTPTEYCRLSPIELGLGAKACNAAEYSICVEPNGDVLPCQSYYEPAGNLLRDDWATIWDSPLFRRMRLRRENPRVAGLDERCYDCPDLPLCGGGCALQREARRREALVHVR